MKNLVRVLAGVALFSAVAPAAWAGGGDCRVVVKFKGKADSRALSRRGVTVDHLDGNVAVGCVAASKIAALRADADVCYVEEDAIVQALGKKTKAAGKPAPTPPPPPPPQVTAWGVAKVWGPTAPASKGAGIDVAIIDTGIDLNHPDLQANVAGSVNFVSSAKSADDDNGHGSHVAGIVAAVDNAQGVVGVAPQAKLWAVKVLDRRGSGYLSDVAAGIDWARTHGIEVANMSLGGPSDSATLSTACDAARDAGVLLVVAAGNSGDGSTATTETGYPAAYASVVAVGATDSGDALAYFSSTGDFVSISAPGVDVYSTYKGGGYATLSGTSMASPHAAGLAAVLWAELGTPTLADLRTSLQTHVVDLGAAGKDAGFGYGRAAYSK